MIVNQIEVENETDVFVFCTIQYVRVGLRLFPVIFYVHARTQRSEGTATSRA